AELCQKNSALFHTDAVQGLGKLDSAFYRSAHLVSISAHKIYGPKGVGALIIKKGTSLVATHYGGAQEIKRRGGTENILGIAGFAGAAQELMTSDSQTISPFIRDYFESTLQKNLEGIWVQGLKEPRIPNTSNIRFQAIPSEVLLGALDLEGIAISAGSACSSGSISPSHVLLNMGLNENEAKECVRFSWGKTSTLQAVEEVAQKVIAHVSRIRARNSTKVISN
ncbi:MAG: aminotransferase class V-fold PLP-dependent enzyme, partial [Deltaproteobacteria bacterium]|nr:aminotransferase class V-fold PLP-dependent enzyme [Deltaproteobacteria bacterium]